jgi:predicted nucleic acid-binding protein
LSTDFADSLTRLQSAISRSALRRRLDSALSFASAGVPLPEPILYDTTVYIDVLQGRLPAFVQRELTRLEPWHSAVVESELAYTCGRLEPAHAGTEPIVRQIASVVERWPARRILAPDRGIWREAAILAGILARSHGARDKDRGRTMNDALIFLTAQRHGCTVLTRNLRDFDLLTQLIPGGQVLFYRTV